MGQGHERRRWKQLGLQSLGTHGGRRDGSGRKRGRQTVVRAARPSLSRHHPVHVTLRVRDDAPRLRRSRAWAVLRAAFRGGRDRFGFRLCHFSVQSNHIHLICEADDRRALSRGMQGLAIRIARRMNRLAGRRGKFFADRYHARQLKTPPEVRNALLYVIQNHAHHDAHRAGVLDVYSSGCYFTGWREPILLPLVDDGPPPLTPARSWLARTGWTRKRGRISISETPS
jgi:REP element-mobilizing transposase RayT